MNPLILHNSVSIVIRCAIYAGPTKLLFMTIPLITHPSYSFDFARRHRFPMEKFGLLHKLMVDKGIAHQANNMARPTSKSCDTGLLSRLTAYHNAWIIRSCAVSDYRGVKV